MGAKIVTTIAGWPKHQPIGAKGSCKHPAFLSFLALALASFPFPSFLAHPSQAMDDEKPFLGSISPSKQSLSLSSPPSFDLEELYSELQAKQEKIEASLKEENPLKYILNLNSPNLTVGDILFLEKKPPSRNDPNRIMTKEERESEKEIQKYSALLEGQIKVCVTSNIKAKHGCFPFELGELKRDEEYLLVTSYTLTFLKEKEETDNQKHILYVYGNGLKAVLLRKAKLCLFDHDEEDLAPLLINEQEKIKGLKEEELKIKGILRTLKYIEHLNISGFSVFSVNKILSTANILLGNDKEKEAADNQAPLLNGPLLLSMQSSSPSNSPYLDLETLYSELHAQKKRIGISLKEATRVYHLLRYILPLETYDLTIGEMLLLKQKLLEPDPFISDGHDVDKLLPKKEENVDDKLKRDIHEIGLEFEREINYKAHKITELYRQSSIELEKQGVHKEDELKVYGQYLSMTSRKLSSLKESDETLYGCFRTLHRLLLEGMSKIIDTPSHSPQALEAKSLAQKEVIKKLERKKLNVKGTLTTLKYIQSLNIPTFSNEKILSIAGMLLEDSRE